MLQCMLQYTVTVWKSNKEPFKKEGLIEMVKNHEPNTFRWVLVLYVLRVFREHAPRAFHFFQLRAIKGNMHHKYDLTLNMHLISKIWLLGFFFWKFWIMSKEAHFVPSLFLLINLTFPSHQPQITISSGRRKTEADEKEWGGWEGKVRGQKNFKKKSQRPIFMVHIPFKKGQGWGLIRWQHK